jgi:DNA-binding transcriptional MerR regulator
MEQKTTKVYFSISEVAKMFDMNESTLRYWETQFPTLRPKTTDTKVRLYTQKDIEQIRSIHNLVKVRGFKLASARKMLSKNPTNVDKTADILTTLISVGNQLKELKKHLDSIV